MLSAYPACFFKEGNLYSVIFPDFENGATCGDDMQDALEMAVNYLATRLFWIEKDEEQRPTPSDIKDVSPESIAKDLDFKYDDVFVSMVTVDVNEYAKTHFNKAVKKTLSIPEWLNESAIAMGVNFSQVLQEALMEKIK